MRNDIYTEYNSKEYRTFKIKDGLFVLVSKDKQDLDNGFFPYEGDNSIYVKNVKRKELGDINSIKTYADYKGRKYAVRTEKDDKILISEMSNGYYAENVLNMKRVGTMEYEMWVDKKDVERIYEEKKLVYTEEK